ncbi:hypothetical protein RRF57_000634 [Xylaria bambusicola]|uniref:Uncharacterized protein n=1 Tax=Xylaria bambusicola TaxID=326684 RepID=A0AAN7UB18_9PEZI
MAIHQIVSLQLLIQSPNFTIDESLVAGLWKCWSHDWSNTPHGQCFTTLNDGKEISYDCATECHTSGASNTTEEPEDNECVKTGRQRTADMPNTEESVRARQDEGASVDLRQRGQEQGPDGVAQQKDTDGERRLRGIRSTELFSYGIDGGGQNGR